MIAAGALLADGTFLPWAEWESGFPRSHAGVVVLYELTEVERRLLIEGQALAAPHVVEFRSEAWSLEHPIGCRGGSLHDCTTHVAVCHDMSHRNTPPRPPGRYHVNLRDNGTPEYSAEPIGNTP